MFKAESEKLNDLTSYDHLMMKSAVEIIYNREYQCSVCVKKMAAEVRERRKGCTGKYPKKRTLDAFTYSICPGNFYSEGYGQLLDLHRMYRKGVLFSAGGLMDQPAKYLDAMNLLENLISQKEIERMEKASKKNGAKSSQR